MELYPYQQLYFTSYRYRDLLPVFPGSVKTESIERLQKESCSFLLVTGIANPTDISGYLANHTADLHQLKYSDHHDFSSRNINEIVETFNEIKNPKKRIITTEKDAVRLMNNPHIPEKIKEFMHYLPVEVVFNLEQENIFIQKIENHVRSIKRNRVLA